MTKRATPIVTLHGAGATVGIARVVLEAIDAYECIAVPSVGLYLSESAT